MKKFSIIALIVAGAIGVIGLICLAVGIGMGATLDDVSSAMVFDSIVPHIGSSTVKDNYETSDLADGTKYTFIDFEDIDIDFGAGELVVEETDEDSAYVIVPDGSKADIKISGKTLKIDCGSRWYSKSNKTLTIGIPKGMAIGKFKLDLGAGKADIVPLTCVDYNLDIGAGETNLALAGARKDYNYDIEVGVGEVRLGDDKFSGLAAEKKENNIDNGSKVDVDCGAGEVTISFETK